MSLEPILDYEAFYQKLYDLQLSEIIENQNLRLSYKDIIRISNGMNYDIFKDKCTLFQNKKINSIYFYKIGLKKKIPLRRLLYMNYINPNIKGLILKTTCKTPGCFTLKHFKIN